MQSIALLKRENSRLLILPVILLVISTACTTPHPSKTVFREAVSCMEAGEHVKAYRTFDQLNREYPGNRDVIAYLATSRGLAFSQSVGKAERFLTIGNLDDFLASMKEANDIQPSDRVKWVIQIVENDMKAGKPGKEILLNLRKHIQSDAAPASVTAVAREIAARIKEQVGSGGISAPIGAGGISPGDSQTTAALCQVVESALSQELISAGVSVISRKDADLKKIAQEHKLAASGASSSPVEAGQIAGAGALLSGTIVSTGQSSYKLQVKCVDASSGKLKLESVETLRYP